MGTAALITNPEVASISFKNADGSKKEGYYLWQDLKELSLVR